MDNKQQGRYLDAKHIKAFKEGVFKKILDGVIEDPELSLEIRRENETMVYYHKDKILTTSFKKGKPSIASLDKKYYEGREKPKTQIEDISKLKSLTTIRDYFKEAKQIVNQWKAEKKKLGEEFIYQQNIALGNQSTENNFLVVDMEWTYSQAEIEKEKRNKTRIDLVAIDTRLNATGSNDIFLIELKVGTKATDNKSGIIDHIEKTAKIINDDYARQALVNDVKSIIECKSDLGLIKGEAKTFNFSSCEKPKMMLILVYRGEVEKKQLEQEETKAIEKAEELGIILKTMKINALIPINTNEDNLT